MLTKLLRESANPGAPPLFAVVLNTLNDALGGESVRFLWAETCVDWVGREAGRASMPSNCGVGSCGIELYVFCVDRGAIALNVSPETLRSV